LLKAVLASYAVEASRAIGPGLVTIAEAVEISAWEEVDARLWELSGTRSGLGAVGASRRAPTEGHVQQHATAEEPCLLYTAFRLETACEAVYHGWPRSWGLDPPAEELLHETLTAAYEAVDKAREVAIDVLGDLASSPADRPEATSTTGVAGQPLWCHADAIRAFNKLCKVIANDAPHLTATGATKNVPQGDVFAHHSSGSSTDTPPSPRDGGGCTRTHGVSERVAPRGHHNRAHVGPPTVLPDHWPVPVVG